MENLWLFMEHFANAVSAEFANHAVARLLRVLLDHVADVAKMRAGHALTDADREPWLRLLADRIRGAAASGPGLVVACSALKRRYRDVLRDAAPEVRFLHLVLDRDTARRRVAARTGHFMPAGLVDSQFDDLEPLEPDEQGAAIDATGDRRATLALARSAVARFGDDRAP
jgi:gluconokinase